MSTMELKKRILRAWTIGLSISAVLAHHAKAADAGTPEAASPESAEMDRLDKEAAQNFATQEGRAYFEKFEKAIMPVLQKALETCSRDTPDTEEPVDVLFVIAADGKVKKFLYTKNVHFGACLGAKLAQVKSAPKPPRDSWVVAAGFANHFHAEQKRPEDKPVHVEGLKEKEEFEKATAPYVAKARETYPAARDRFLAGLPAGHTLFVSVWLADGAKHENSFVRVGSVEQGKISGTVASELNVVTNYKMGDKVTFPESEITNWLIQRPDGSEEGNEVGKFLDTYRKK